MLHREIETRERMATVWYGAALQRAKKLPEFRQFVPGLAGVSGKRPGPSRPTPARAAAMAKQMAALVRSLQLVRPGDGSE